MDGHDQAGEPPIRFRVLGPLEVSDGTRSLPLGGLTQRTFLAYLLLHANRAVPLAQVIDALWGANPPPSAKNMLHNAVWRLRKLLSGIDGAELVSQKPGYLLRIPPELLDVHHFQRLLELGRTASAAGGTHSATAIFREALALWRGPADFGGRPWPILAVLEESRLGAWEECFEAELSLGRHREVISELTELVAAEPLRERLCGQLMLALYRSGRQAEALTAYRRIRAKCATELGIEPGPELRRLERAILNQDAGLSGPQEVRPAGDGERWKRRQLSALLVRLAGETAHQLVSVVRAEAERFGGVVVSAIGTTVLTLFGAECTREDDPARAVGAALSLKDRLGDADVRMTVTTGVVPVSSGPGGAPIVAAGLEPGLALLDTAGPQEIRVCPDTYAMSRALIEYTAGRIPVAKRSEPAPPDAGPIRLVGRDRELATLRRALDDTVRTRRPQLVTLLGGAGAGKSRLVAELVHAAETRIGPVLAVVSRTHPFSRDPAFHGLATIVRACLGIDPPEHGPRTGEVRRAWAAFLDELAAERPLAVVFEDVHLAEDALLGFLDELPGRLGHVPLLLVVTARPELLERRPDWGGGKPDATTLTLEPLSAPETAGLLHELFREHGVPEVSRDGEFWHALVTAVGGNPL
ncbi:MAG TPA: BTAD domain-containing putative transcriptional regulator, partial [Amycolatopsis sp.]|nr:BTAD domain-containing putative transcriptional regulator [Amycolatopsis sp.]